MPARRTADVAARPDGRTRGVVLGDRLGSRANNFDLLRLLAAWAVLVSHSYALVGRDQPLHQVGTSLGNVGVLVFFAVSGLLIRRSWEHDPRPRDFWVKRALRLVPALAVTAVLTAFVLGPAVTSQRLGSYFASWETWLYPVRLVLMVPFGAQLPGVFDHNVDAGGVNGSLWSLPLEVVAYALVAGLGVLGLLGRRWLVAGLALGGLVWAGWWESSMSDAVGSGYVIAAFALGAAAFTWRDRIVLSAPVAGLVLAACAISCLGPEPVRVVTWVVGAVYLSYWFAYGLPRVGRVLTRFGDTSYGLYIWAFPVQQVVVQLAGNEANPWLITAIATPVVWLLALASWRLVERPALRLRPRPTPGGPDAAQPRASL